jgi:hypothetical protein
MSFKELNEEEIQNYILSDPKNEIMTFYQDNKEHFKTHYFIRGGLKIQLIQCLIFQKYFF